MIILIVYCILVFVTFLAIVEVVRTCVSGEDDVTKRKIRLWSAPLDTIKNKIRGMKPLKEATTTAPACEDASNQTPEAV